MDNRGLLGFYNLLTGAYQPSELLKIMLRAQDDPDRPYFVILDEMNLAKVEYYFSDFLSCLESRMEGEDGNVIQEPIYLHDQEEDLEYVDETGETFYIPPSIRIPTNLYFTGTVNVDETTYMFSPKVLDRANTIEFNEVDLAGYAAGKALTSKAGIRLQKSVDARSQFPGFELASADHYRSLDAATRNDLEVINAILADYHLHFGYRVANEIALYMKNAQELTGNENINTSLDLQILQKVLPKFHGSRQKLEEPLLRLFAFCFDETPEEQDYHSFLESHAGTIESARFPRSARKIKRMLEVLGDQGFASFVE
jgi:5-methylcytosine-specific restriction endonuclease McrBC GTP-binding regulatory subunit McrB